MKSIILFSGGLDSTVMLAMALKKGRDCLALSFDYGQRHVVELEAARKIAFHYEVPHQIIKIDVSCFGATPLVMGKEGPKDRSKDVILSDQLSPYYVPARNTIFLSFAMGKAEVIGAEEIWIGSNANDTSFPDCSDTFRCAFQEVMHCAVPGKPAQLIAPLIHMNKAAIVEQAIALDVPIEMTHSCYAPNDGIPCGRCDACVIRNSVYAYRS